MLGSHRVQRVLTILARLRTLVAPRVQAAFLRAVCNGWNTSARYQGTAACRFGCAQELDSISHFAVCPYTNEWAQRFANFRRAPLGLGLDYFFCMNSEAFCIDETSLPFATSDSVLQALRHNTILSGDLAGAYHQYFREAQLALAFLFLTLTSNLPSRPCARSALFLLHVHF